MNGGKDLRRGKGSEPCQSVDEIAISEHLAFQLRRFHASEPAPTRTRELAARLSAQLAVEVGANQEAGSRESESDWQWPEVPSWTQLFAAWIRLGERQVSTARPLFWVASFVLAIVGGLLLPYLFGAQQPQLSWTAPLVGCLGAIYFFRSGVFGISDLERSLPIRPHELFLVRLCIVLFYNVLLAVVASWVAVPIFHSPVTLHLLFGWFGPLFALTGAATFALVRWGEAAAAGSACGLWGAWLYAARLYAEFGESFLPGVVQAMTAAGPLVHVGAVVVGLAFVAAAARTVTLRGSMQEG